MFTISTPFGDRYEVIAEVGGTVALGYIVLNEPADEDGPATWSAHLYLRGDETTLASGEPDPWTLLRIFQRIRPENFTAPGTWRQL